MNNKKALELLAMAIGGFVIIWVVTLLPESEIPVQGKRLLQVAGLLMMVGATVDAFLIRMRQLRKQWNETRSAAEK